MNCPACRDVMIVIELDRVEVDHCVSCGGIWFDGGELELLLGNEREKNNLLESFQIENKSKETKRKCPMCSKKMKKVLGGHNHDVRIDRCKQNHGMWFDRDELQAILKDENASGTKEVIHFLKEIFGKRV